MILDCVLTSTNNNKLYSGFIPYFIKMWNLLYPEVDVKIIFIGDEIPNEYLKYKKNLLLFKPPKNISTSFISQYIRLLYPCLLNYKNGILITDIDDVPMNKTYFKNNIKNIPNSKWINLRDWKTNTEISMCWQVACPQTWKEVFNINSIEDLENRIKTVNNSINYEGHDKNGWTTDQVHLKRYVDLWNKKTNNYIFLKDADTKFSRLGRNRINNLDNNIKNKITEGFYSDYHCLRPMCEYKDINEEIYKLLSKLS